MSPEYLLRGLGTLLGCSKHPTQLRDVFARVVPERYPWIEAALKNRYKQFVIDGEAVVLGIDGISDFNALHSGEYNDEVQLYAFDILALNGDDLRSLRLSMRKAHLERLLTPRPGWNLHQLIRAGRDRPRLFSARPATWDSKAWSRNVETALIGAADRRTG